MISGGTSFLVLEFSSRTVPSCERTSERAGSTTPWLSAIETEVISLSTIQRPNLKQELLLFLYRECGEGRRLAMTYITIAISSV